MDYEQALNTINSLLRFGIKPGLGRIAALLDKMGNPQRRLQVVHVAGTNGKGSTCALVASVLQKAGYKTGLYTSPYVTDFRERMQINGEMIPKGELCALVESIYPLARAMEQHGESITEFEFITAAAFQWFAQSQCDFVVLEVGLGGRFDATNVIDTPLVSVITSISLDHTAILGDTVEQIAFEKCGILKTYGSAVSYPHQAPAAAQVIEQAAKDRGVTLLVPNPADIQVLKKSLCGMELLYKDKKLHLPFIGEHQVYNALTALAALSVLKGKGIVIRDEAVAAGFAAARIPARLELLSRRPLCLLDGAHNPGGAEALASALRDLLPGKKIIGIMGMLKDKDSHLALQMLAPLFAKLITVTPDNPRALNALSLAERAKGLCADITPMDDVNAALHAAAGEAGGDGAVVICGSLYLAGQIRPIALSMFHG